MNDEDDHPVSLPASLDEEKLAEAAIALLSLTLEDGRVWKTLDWNLMNLLYNKGWILDPVSKTKSVVLTEAGESAADASLRTHFAK